MCDYSDELVNLSQNITLLRNAKGLTQAQLAKATGMSPQTIKSLETGAVGKRFGARQLVALAQCFGCPVSLLFSAGL